MSEISLTEADAARTWALAYNTHDPWALGQILSADVRVMSRWVVNDLVGRDTYLEYLRRKFLTLEQAGSVVRVETGNAPGDAHGIPGRPCALIEQDGALLATVFFEVIGGRLAQISLGPFPAPESCRRSGEFPGIDGEAEIVN